MESDYVRWDTSLQPTVNIIKLKLPTVDDQKKRVQTEKVVEEHTNITAYVKLRLSVWLHSMNDIYVLERSIFADRRRI